MEHDQTIPKLSEKERSMRAAQSRAVRPRLASTLVLMHGPKNAPKILMGKRASRHDFMPSVFVFPGGRVDRSDSYAPYAGDLSTRTERILEAAHNPRRARACVLASVRETWEETGIMLGREGEFKRNINDPGWDAFRKAGMLPDLDGIEVFGRAITPPYRHKRFDAWFFVKHLEGERPVGADSRELQDVGWFSFEEFDDLPMQRATTMMVSVLKDYLKAPRAPEQVFFSRMERGTFIGDGFPK